MKSLNSRLGEWEQWRRAGRDACRRTADLGLKPITLLRVGWPEQGRLRCQDRTMIQMKDFAPACKPRLLAAEQPL